MTTGGKDNLTREEARERADLLGDLTYDVDLDLRSDGDSFASTTTLTFAGQAGASTFIDLDGDVRSIELNGSSVDAAAIDGRVQLPSLQERNELRIVADCAYSRTGTGLHRFRDPSDGNVYLYTQFEPFDAHRVFACFDQPDLKGPFTFAVDAPDGATVISNTRPVAEPSGGRWAFAPTPVMSTYLGCLCVGPFHGVTDHHDGIDLAWWCSQAMAKHMDPDELFEITKQGFDFFHELFGARYPLDSYDQVFCPEYKFGAMENWGCVTYTDRFIFRSQVTEAQRERRAEVILHEMSHMWFGDLVTMRWWDDLWLNESFATYMAYLAKQRATRFTNSWVTFINSEKDWAYEQDQLPTTHPIVADIPDVEATHLNFDGITYAKGASVLKQLVAWVGDDAFARGLRRYFADHAYGNTELNDFLAPLEAESGRDLKAWTAEWLQTTGVNTLRPATTGDETIETLDILQEAADDHPTLRSHRIGVGIFAREGGSLSAADAIEMDVTGPTSPVKELVGRPVPDLLLVNHQDLTFAKIRFEERSLRTLEDGLRDVDDPLARMLCWAALWDMVLDAELEATRFRQIALKNADAEDDIGSLTEALDMIRASVDVYGAVGNRSSGRDQVASFAREHMRGAEPGSDRQLVFARAALASDRSPEGLAFARALLDGEQQVDGLTIDTDLRWAIVARLAASGVADDALIDAEAERDPTDLGQRNAAAARASRPTADAKAAAWEQANDDGLTLALLRALTASFHRGDDDGLLEPYADAYFQRLLGYYADKEFDLGVEFARGMYPRLYSSDVTDRTDELLARDDVPPPLRRVLLEKQHGTRRVMRARERDA